MSSAIFVLALGGSHHALAQAPTGSAAPPPPSAKPVGAKPTGAKPATPAPSPPVPGSTPDVVELTDGTRLEGKILANVPGSHVTIRAPDGTERTIAWVAVRLIEEGRSAGAPLPVAPPLEPPPVAAAPARAPAVSPAPPSTARPVKRAPGVRRSRSLYVTRDELQAHFERDCSEGDKECRHKAHLEASRQGAITAQYDWQKDCSNSTTEYCRKQAQILADNSGQLRVAYEVEKSCANTESDYCREKGFLKATPEGVGIGLQRESATAVTKVRTSAVAFGGSVGALVGGGKIEAAGSETKISMGGALFDAGVRVLGGQRFPGPEGGRWFGGFVEPGLGFYYMSMKMKMDMPSIPGYPAGGETESESSLSAVRLGVTVGLEGLWYRPLKDQKKLTQPGIGFALGGLVGLYQPLKDDAGKGSATSGPALNLLFPNRNPGTSKFQSVSLNLLVLPTKYITFGLATLSFQFG